MVETERNDGNVLASSSYRNGNLAQNAVGLLLILTKSDVDPETLHYAIDSIEKEWMIGQCRETGSEIQDLQNCFTESLETAVDFLTEKELRRRIIRDIQKKPESLDITVESEIDENENSKNYKKCSDDKELCKDTADEQIKRHMRTHLDNDYETRRQHECEECGKRFPRPDSLRIHKRIHLSDETARRPYECNNCGKRFAQLGHLHKHNAIHLPDSMRTQFHCHICGKSVTSKASLKMHLRSHIDNDEERRPYKCEECGQSFGYANYLTYHLRTHMPDFDPSRREFECDICGKNYKNKNQLVVHKKIHLGQEEVRLPFKCEECGRRFSDAKALRQHQTIHMDVADPRKKKFECEICGKFFAQNGTLKTHMLTHLDANDPEQAKIKHKFKCDVCEKLFAYKSNLTVHMFTHTGGFPFKCEICSSGFLDKPRLDAHMKLHKKGLVRPSKQFQHRPDDEVKRPFKCEYCVWRFSNKKALRRHQTIHLDKSDPLRYRKNHSGLLSNKFSLPPRPDRGISSAQNEIIEKGNVQRNTDM